MFYIMFVGNILTRPFPVLILTVICANMPGPESMQTSVVISLGAS